MKGFNKTTKRGRLLSSDTRLVENAKNCLAALWRIILRDLDINEERWNLLMNIYLTDPINGFNVETRALGDKRGNLNKALCADKIQMLNFNRALRFLQTERITYNFTIYYEDSNKFPTKTYSMNILHNHKGVAQKEEINEVDTVTPIVKRRQFVNTYRKQNLDAVSKKYSGDFTLDQWLEDPNKKSTLATGMLSKIWRIILTDLKMDKSTWKILTARYQRLIAPECNIITGKETSTELRAKSKRKSNIKGNITDELQRPSFSIDVFMKGMVFLKVKKVDLSVDLKRLNNAKITTHRLTDWNPMHSIRSDNRDN